MARLIRLQNNVVNRHSLFLPGCAIGEYLFGNDHRVNGSGKPGKDRNRENDFHNFGFSAADIQCAIDMHHQLGLACTERRKR